MQHSEAARFWNCEAFNVNPLPAYGCKERVRIAGLRLTRPPSSRQRPGGVRTSVPRNELPDCCERRAHNRPILDLRLTERAQLLLDHPGGFHLITDELQYGSWEMPLFMAASLVDMRLGALRIFSGKLIGSITKLRVAELATTVDTKFSHRAAS